MGGFTVNRVKTSTRTRTITYYYVLAVRTGGVVKFSYNYYAKTLNNYNNIIQVVMPSD